MTTSHHNGNGNHTTAKRDFHVSIIGGGIGGISAAIGLVRAGVHVDVFEAANAYGEIGAGISFGKNASTALETLGLGEEFQQQATMVPSGVWFEWREGAGQEQKLIATTRSPPHGNTSVHRARFLDAMVKHVPDSVSHFGKRLKSVEELQEGERLLRMSFEDGTTFDTDVILGFDGVKSKVREYVLQHHTPAKLQWSGTWAYRGLIPYKEFVAAVGEKGDFYARTPQMFLAKDTHVLIFPIDHHETVNLVAFTTDRSTWPARPNLDEGEAWTQETTTDEMLGHFKGWGEDVLNMLRCMKKPSRWALHQLIPGLETYVNGTVSIAGDAAHGGTPHQGAMAGQAMEDAVFLSWLFAQPQVTKATLKKTLQVFDTIRRPRANKVLATSLEAGDIFEFAGTQGDDYAALKKELEPRWDWIWGYDPNVEFDEAKKMMQAW